MEFSFDNIELMQDIHRELDKLRVNSEGHLGENQKYILSICNECYTKIDEILAKNGKDITMLRALTLVLQHKDSKDLLEYLTITDIKGQMENLNMSVYMLIDIQAAIFDSVRKRILKPLQLDKKISRGIKDFEILNNTIKALLILDIFGFREVRIYKRLLQYSQFSEVIVLFYERFALLRKENLFDNELLNGIIYFGKYLIYEIINQKFDNIIFNDNLFKLQLTSDLENKIKNILTKIFSLYNKIPKDSPQHSFFINNSSDNLEEDN